MNCHRNYPWYRGWYDRFADRGLTMIGIHTPETKAEHDVETLQRKVAEADLRFPVLADNDKKNWDAWGNSVWPSVYLIDKTGRLRYWWYGELNWRGAEGERIMGDHIEELLDESDDLTKATFGNGCFWCTEAVFQQMKGVEAIVSGYSGGQLKNPTYKAVCTGSTGHAEVIQITYDPKVVSYEELLEVFWKTHDPTTLNRQGNDIGPQYRSVIFYHTDEQKKLAQHYKQKLDAAKVFERPIVTEISPFTEFYPAEGYHQRYFEQNSRQPYCQAVIRPKVEKFKKVFRDKLKGHE